MREGEALPPPGACIVGAGSSGIAAAKAFLERGVPFDCFEASDRVGGNWVFGNRNQMSSAYASLHINTSRERMAYSDFPMPRSYPDFPHHTQIAAYFDAYVDHFGVRDHITFSTKVEHAQPQPGGGWRVTLATGESRDYAALVVANGHHWDPRWPEPSIPGEFSGRILHAHDYRDSGAVEDRDVVVLGMGNSAMDIAVESSYVARSTVLAARRGAYIVPKYLFGRPADQLLALSPRVPFAIRRAIADAVLRVAVGPVERYGLPRPDHRLGEAHPTISSDLLSRVSHGAVTVKPTITRFAGDRVEFADGSSTPAEVVVLATGYKISFPFLDPDVVDAPDNQVNLFHRVFPPDRDDLYFAGLLQPLGAVMPLAEVQSQWIADHLLGEYALPSTAEMQAEITRDRRRMAKRYVRSKRHTIQVDFDDYLLAVRRERRAGRRRASAAGRPAARASGVPA